MKTGYIEGYYGKELSFGERERLMYSLADLKMTHYFYCPKEDPYHRMQWKEDYDQDFLANFSALNKVAISNNIEVIFGLSPGCLLYTSPSPRDATLSRMPSSA